MLYKDIQKIFPIIKDKIIQHYQERLLAIVIFGSVARKTSLPDSDLDILIVATQLPKGQYKRIEEFLEIENKIEKEISSKLSCTLEISPIIKTPSELWCSPIVWDMIESKIVLYEKDKFFSTYIRKVEKKLQKLGAYKIKDRNIWIIKKEFIPGEIFTL